MTLSSPRPTPARSGPSSGKHRRENENDLDTLAAEVLRTSRRWSVRLRVSEPDAEDLVQDALVLLLENGRNVVPPARRSWFFAALRNRKLGLARDRARAKAREPMLEVHMRGQPPPFPAPDDELLQRQREAAVRWLIEQVHASRRAVVYRHLCDDATLEEIAEETGTPIGTVRSRWERAKRDMRAAIEREQGEEGGESWLVILAALLGGAWLWLLGRGRDAVRSHDGPSAMQRVKSSGVPATVVFVSAALCSTLMLHSPLERPGTVAQDEEVVRVFETHDAFAPSLSVSAESERERLDPAPESLGAPGRETISGRGMRGYRERARRLLGRATMALHEGDLAAAREALRRYDTDLPHNPFPQQRAQLGAAVAALAARTVSCPP